MNRILDGLKLQEGRYATTPQVLLYLSTDDRLTLIPVAIQLYERVQVFFGATR